MPQLKELDFSVKKKPSLAGLDFSKPLFDPEGMGYDYESAKAAGLFPDETGHWPSRVPSTGLLLKGRKHETWPLTVQGEKEVGYEIQKGKDGRYYSRKRKFPPPTEFLRTQELPAMRQEAQQMIGQTQRALQSQPYAIMGEREDETAKTVKGRVWSDEELATTKQLMETYPDQFTREDELSLWKAEARTHPWRAMPDQLKTIITKGISTPFGWGEWLAPGIQRELKEEISTIPGIYSPMGEAVSEGIDTFLKFKYIYPILFRSLGFVGKIPYAQKAGQALKKITGLKKLSQIAPRLERLVSTSLAAFPKGAVVGGGVTGIEAYNNGLSWEQAKPLIVRDAAIMGSVATAFNVAGFLDTQMYVNRMRKSMIAATRQKYANMNRQVAQMPAGPKKTRASKGLASMQRTDLKTIDRIVSEVEGQLIGVKAGKLYQTGQKEFDSPRIAAQKFIKGEQLRSVPGGIEALEKELIPRQRDILTGQPIRTGRPIPAKVVTKAIKQAPRGAKITPVRPVQPITPTKVAPKAPAIEAEGKVGELQAELRKLETLAPRMSEGAISATQLNRMGKQQRKQYDKNMARRYEVEAEIKELQKTPEQRAKEEKAITAKKTSDRLLQIKAQIDMLQRVGIGKRGVIKPSYQKRIDALEAERQTLAKPEVVAPAKEAWEMGKAQFADWYNDLRIKGRGGKVGEASDTIIKEQHKSIIQDALSEGKPVPRAVLEEYKSEPWAKEALEKPKKLSELEFTAEAVKKMPEDITTKAEISKEVKSHKIDILPHKEELLAKIDEAIKKAPKTSDGKTIHFEINGGINVYNDKRTLEFLRDRVKAQQPTEVWPAKPPRRYKVGQKIPLKPGRPGKAIAQNTEQYAEQLFASLEEKALAKKTKGSLAADLRKLEGSIPQDEWQILNRELEDYSSWRPEQYLETIKLYRSVNKKRLDIFKVKPKPPKEVRKLKELGGVQQFKEGEGEEVELGLEVGSGSPTFNKHIEYFLSKQLPESSKIRKIQKAIRVINGKRLAGTLTPPQANKRIHKLRQLLYRVAQKEGISVRMTRGGKVYVAVRKAGTYVPEEFSQYGKFQNVRPLGQDVTRSVQQIDGSLRVKEKKQMKGQAGAVERYVLWPTREMSMQKLAYIKEKSAILKKILKTKRGTKEDAQINEVLEKIAKEDRNQPIKNILGAKTIKSMGIKPKVVRQAVELRKFYDDTIEEQNQARKMRNQDPIAYRHNYSPHILRNVTIWERMWDRINLKDPGEHLTKIFGEKADLPDYIKPNKPFNPRELAREAGIPYEERVKSAIDLARSYLVTAAKDIFNTSIIQNNKAFIQQLETMGYDKPARYLGDWTAESYAGIKPSLDRALQLTQLHRTQRGMRRFNKIRNLAVFPFNLSWNLLTQTSSLALTVGRYGTINTAKGFYQWLKPSIRKQAAQDYYSFIVKSTKQGKITKQDAQNLIGESVQLRRTKGELVRDISVFFLEQLERILTGTSIRAAHLHGIKRGLTGEALKNYASDGGAKTQSMYNDEDKPALLRNLTVKTAAPYQTFAYEVMNTMREWAGRTGTPPDTKLYTIWTVLRFLAAATVFATIAKKGANKDVWSWKRPPIPFAEFWLSPIIRHFTGEYIRSASGLTSPIETASRIADGLEDVFATGSWRKLRNELIKYGPGIFGVPGGVQWARTIDAIIAYSQGGLKDRRGRMLFKMEEPPDLIQGIFGGVWSTKGGREYIEARKGGKKEEGRKIPSAFRGGRGTKRRGLR